MSATETKNFDAIDVQATEIIKPQHKDNKKCGPLAIMIVFGLAVVGAVVGGILGSRRDRAGPDTHMIKGTWKSNFGSFITITDTHWYQVSSWSSTAYTITELTDNFAIMQNPDDADYNPSQWRKEEFHQTSDGWAFCSSVYDAATAAEAKTRDTSAIYFSNNATHGCNGFGHTRVTPYALPIAGTWTTNWQETITVTPTQWKVVASYGTTIKRIEAYGKNFLLMQNAADADYNAGMWTKLEFHTDGSGFGFCESVYDGATAEAALTHDTTTKYIATNATHGCNGFGHTIASPAPAN